MQHRSGGGFDTPIRYMGLHLLCLTDCIHRNMPVFLEDSFLILEHKVSFGFVPFPSSVLIYKNVPRGKPAFNARLSCQWSVA